MNCTQKVFFSRLNKNSLKQEICIHFTVHKNKNGQFNFDIVYFKTNPL